MKPLQEEKRLRRTETGERFPLRIVIQTPSRGFSECSTTMMDWLDENCGVNGWSIAPASTRCTLNDSIAVYVRNPTCALAFIARWCLPGDPLGLYKLQADEPERRVPTPHHKTP